MQKRFFQLCTGSDGQYAYIVIHGVVEAHATAAHVQPQRSSSATKLRNILQLNSFCHCYVNCLAIYTLTIVIHMVFHCILYSSILICHSTVDGLAGKAMAHSQ